MTDQAVAAHADLTSALIRVRDALAHGTAGLAAGTPENYAHAERLAIRRARAAIRAGSPHLGLTLTRALVDDMRWLARLLGTVRDLDVAAEHMAATCPPELWRAIAPCLAAERAEALSLVRTGLSSGRMDVLEERLAEAVAHSRSLDTADLERAAARRARQLLVRLQLVTAEPENLLGHEPLHELRKLLRNLRYTLELLPARETAVWFAAIHAELHHLQDWFGQIQDLTVQCDVIARIRRFHVRQGSALREPLEAYAARQAHARDALVVRFPAVIAPLLRAIEEFRLPERLQALRDA